MTSFEAYGGVADPLAKYGGYCIPTPGVTQLQFHEKIADSLFVPARYKVLEGGRGGMKSWGVARALLIMGLQRPMRILCAREFMTSIEDSVYKLLRDQIVAMNLGMWYTVQKNGIFGTNGTEFLFIGLADMTQRLRRTKVKSYEGIDVCWIEEAESITDESWSLLIPTIRKKGSEIWIVYNPNLASDATYKRFHEAPPAGTMLTELNWRDNLWITKELLDEKDHLFAVDPESAAHVWDGELRKHAEAAVFKGKFVIHNFITPVDSRFYHGVDWGFSADPSVLLRMFITGKPPYEELWIDREAWGIGVEINELAQDYNNPASKAGLFDKIDTFRKWPIKADASRPECISYLRRNCGINIVAAEKWQGSVEDGIKHLRGFQQIHIHKDGCPHTAEEFRLYAHRVDKMTGEVLPGLVDRHNHCPDAARYALSDFIQRRGVAAMWARLAS